METSSRMVDVMSADTQAVVALSAPLCPGPSLHVCCGPGAASFWSLGHCRVNAPLSSPLPPHM